MSLPGGGRSQFGLRLANIPLLDTDRRVRLSPNENAARPLAGLGLSGSERGTAAGWSKPKTWRKSNGDEAA